MSGFAPGVPAPPLWNFTSRGAVPSGLEIRAPRAIDVRAWRMLLPQVATRLERSRVLVATLPYPSPHGMEVRRVVGAAAATEHYVQVPFTGPRVIVHVIPPLRRQGIGRALIEAIGKLVTAVSTAQRRDAQVLYAGSLVAPGAPEEAIWRSLGFTGETRVRIHDLDAVEAEARLRPLFQRIESRIPQDVSMIFLEQATAAQKQQIADMHVKYLGGRTQQMQSMLADWELHYRGHSLVLLQRDRVIGFSLTRMVEPDVTNIDANVIEPEHRKTWANVYLKYEEARSQLADGIRKTQFQTFDHHYDTRRFAERTGVVDTGYLLWLHRPLNAIPSAP